MARVTKRLMAFTLFGSDATGQCSEYTIESDDADSDFVTFADAAAGGARQYTLKATIVQDHATGTVWDKLWSAPGSSVAGVYKPYGNATPSATQPHYSFNAIVSEPNGPMFGGEADPSPTAYQTVEIEWQLDGKPVKVTS